VPDRHLIVETGRLISIRSPKEDWYRPSINVLFRSAALAYGPRVVGMVLTGLLDDGAEGLRAIKARGGLVFVQDPGEAQFAMMPEAALRSVTADRVLPLQDLGKAIMDESRRDAPSDEQFPVSTELELEVQIAKQALSPDELVRAIERIGTRSMLTCPECQGTLWEVRAGRLRFRCHVGHAYSAEALATGQSRRIEDSLWSALRALEEKAQLFRRMADKFRVDAAHVAADKYERDADQLQERVTTLRTFIMGGLTDSPRQELP
jgi:two-component system chemotaxis response regulator CheB